MVEYKRSLSGIILVAAWAAACTGDCWAADSSQSAARREIASALDSEFPGTADARRSQARRFLSLYAAAGDLPAAEQARLRVRLKSRLARLVSGIRHDLREAQRAQSAESAAQSDAAQSKAAPSKAAQSKAALPKSTASTILSTSGAAPKTIGRAGGGGGAQDEGQALVDLIEATIAPETWDVNGGSAAVRYWPAWHVLVVRQTDDVHEQIGGVVRGLRK